MSTEDSNKVNSENQITTSAVTEPVPDVEIGTEKNPAPPAPEQPAENQNTASTKPSNSNLDDTKNRIRETDISSNKNLAFDSENLSNARKILGVSDDATSEECRKAYIALSRQVHPDKNKDDDAKDIFQKLSTANTLLQNDFERKATFSQNTTFTQSDAPAPQTNDATSNNPQPRQDMPAPQTNDIFSGNPQPQQDVPSPQAMNFSVSDINAPENGSSTLKATPQTANFVENAKPISNDDNIVVTNPPPKAQTQDQNEKEENETTEDKKNEKKGFKFSNPDLTNQEELRSKATTATDIRQEVIDSSLKDIGGKSIDAGAEFLNKLLKKKDSPPEPPTKEEKTTDEPEAKSTEKEVEKENELSSKEPDMPESHPDDTDKDTFVIAGVKENDSKPMLSAMSDTSHPEDGISMAMVAYSDSHKNDTEPANTREIADTLEEDRSASFGMK